MIKDQDYIRRLEAKIVELTMSNDDLWQENTDLQDELRELRAAPKIPGSAREASNSWSDASTCAVNPSYRGWPSQ
ncbi:hypothetical protein ASE85_03320 [Sphingobium sp. Leaf26]|uniref:hypothetical protein n=1 Tax=Sphingobium sp. Leaf26 TaxID=1735693 RepID=UPI0006FA5884|nr:hypothetical protein [Sphingobium sp. Leaf26]KQN09974.1 hypothetical protein ASE85_03320 [Sphingobium sp. Leaf26]